jgi:thiamine-monophosphate kinase
MPEFELIELIRRRSGHARADVRLGIGDDAAVLRVPRRHELVVSTDTLVSGVHFPPDTAPEAVGWKALAVNLSDLAAMGATPAWATLALTLPDASAGFVRAFMRGFATLARRHRVALVGGDTTRGPLACNVGIFGFVPEGRALRRDGAKPGDDVYVSGTIGDAAAGLALRQGRRRVAASVRRALVRRLECPEPRVALGLALRGIASAAIDVSDGLAADLGHVLAASALGARIERALLPASPALARVAPDDTRRHTLQLEGGDDYELCFTAAPRHAARLVRLSHRLRLPLTRIGSIESRRGLRIVDASGRRMVPARGGYEHFRS